LSNRASEERDIQHSRYLDISDKLTMAAKVARILLAENAGTDALTRFSLDHIEPFRLAARFA
jgi:hypothetical protein